MMTGNVQTLYTGVQSNQLDVAIIRAPLPLLPDDLQSRPFTTEKAVLALPRQHSFGGLRRADACVGERGEVDRPARPGGDGAGAIFL